MVSHTRYFKRVIFKAGALAKSVRNVLKNCAAEPDKVSVSVWESLPDGTRHSIDYKGQENFDHICDLSQRRISASFNSNLPGARHTSISIDTDEEDIEIDVFSGSFDVLNRVFQSFITDLGLEEVVKKPTSPIKDISKRLTILEAKVSGSSRRLRCFLSYRFSPDSENIAFRVERFLTLLEIEVIKGTSYEPRSISEKVMERLNQPLDFIVLLLTSNGESMWTRDEIAAALQKDIAVVPLVEEGVAFAPGLFGDLEYIKFAHDHIGDAFLKLLEAVTFVRQQKPATKVTEQ